MPIAAAPLTAVLVPVALALVLGLLGGRLGRASAPLAMLGPLALLVVGATNASRILSGPLATAFAPSAPSPAEIPWFRQGGTTIGLGFAADGLASVMLLVVGVVALMVMVFSVSYMAGERGYARYFAVLSLFTAAMASLVTATTLVTLVFSWELVGACSYLLIGFWYDKPAAADAAMKAFLVTHVGDAGMLLGLAVLCSRKHRRCRPG
jgi:NADH:ubiquinone oxidoreductase subunit 5 (subunit L)/multisubunit Na+/H+ antiporter MnhA subunit